MTYFIKTFGCQANKSDSERIAGDYQARGFSEAKSWQKADEIVINTCSVRQRAEDRVAGFLNNIKKYFQNSPKPKIILTGCMLHYGKAKIKESLSLVDEVLPINEVGFNLTALRKDKTHAWVPISSGCNSFCTFCIVPYSRGREKSRPAKDIISEVKRLAAQNYQEITLLGQNVNSYGLEKTGIGYRKLLLRKKIKIIDIPSNISQYQTPSSIPPFVDLLRQISKIKNIQKINFMTSNPWDFWDELIDEIANNKKIDKFVHLPVQSGSDRILKLMNRGYSSSDYLSLINKIRIKIPNVVLGTDIIVGFPTETQKDFQDTVKLVKKANFTIAFVAQYSPRPGTAAFRIYQDNISPQEKKRRWQILDDLINKRNFSSRPKIR